MTTFMMYSLMNHDTLNPITIAASSTMYRHQILAKQSYPCGYPSCLLPLQVYGMFLEC